LEEEKGETGKIKLGKGVAAQEQLVVPALHNAQAEVTTPREVDTTITIPSVNSAQPVVAKGPKIPVLYHWHIIATRIALTIIWLLAFSLTIVMCVWVGNDWNGGWRLPAIIIENILSFTQACVMGALAVLSIRERERVLFGGQEVEAGEGGTIKL